MTGLNLGLRFVLELVGVAALGYWGFSLEAPSPVSIVAGLVAPAILVVGWARIVAPRASNPIGQQARMLIGSVFLVVAAGFLALAGQPAVAAVFAIVVVVNTALMLALGGPESVAGGPESIAGGPESAGDGPPSTGA